ncbi:hypothetical protein ACFL5Q_07900, partial [Planctomycetota bacterium]
MSAREEATGRSPSSSRRSPVPRITSGRAVVPSPISGVVDAVNELLASQPSTLFTDPCGKGWIACVCTTR